MGARQWLCSVLGPLKELPVGSANSVVWPGGCVFAGVLCEASFGDLAQNILDLRSGLPGRQATFRFYLLLYLQDDPV